MARKYHCMFCNQLYERPKLIDHIEKKHPEMIPEGYDAARLVFDKINNTTGGKCRVCGEPTKWNGSRYDVLCDNPACKKKLREQYKQNMLRVKGTYNILNDPEQQKVMLSHRKIAGKYHHSDGGEIEFFGQYELKFLEFIDNFMQIPSKDIISPGPTIEYFYKGKKHIYIPDFIYVPYNLIIEIKDGGDNINNKQSQSMIESREKTIEKERIITDKGLYNYIRLTNNQFVQLVEVFMEIKEKLLNEDESKVVKVNEAKLTIPSAVNRFFVANGTLSVMQLVQAYNANLNELGYPDDVDTDFVKYRTLSVKDFYKLEMGICYDYVLAEDTWFEENLPDIDRECYFIISQDESQQTNTHTFLIFRYLDSWYWFESAWKSYPGVRGFKSKKECLKYVAYLFNKDFIKPSSYMISYKPNDKRLIDVTIDQFCGIMMDRLSIKDKIKNIEDGKNVKYISKIN